MARDGLGAPITRREDQRFLPGTGRYLDDIKLPGMAYLAILRSPYAHANIRSVNVDAAKSMPGVLAAFTGADIPYNPLPMAWPAGGSAGLQNNINTPRGLATDSGKWTGEGGAAVVADTPEQAVDALSAISPDIGGAFGTKIYCYADMALVMFASKALDGRPVKWVESRTESYQSTIHGRDHITYIEIAAKRDGEVTGLKVKTYANLGGRLS